MSSVNACSSPGPFLRVDAGNYRNRRSVETENAGNQSENQNEIQIDYLDYDSYIVYIPSVCETEIMILDGEIPDRHYAGLYRIDYSRGKIRGRPVWKHVELEYILCFGPDGWSIMTTSEGGLAWTLAGETPTPDPLCPEPLLATGGYGFRIEFQSVPDSSYERLEYENYYDLIHSSEFIKSL